MKTLLWKLDSTLRGWMVLFITWVIWFTVIYIRTLKDRIYQPSNQKDYVYIGQFCILRLCNVNNAGSYLSYEWVILMISTVIIVVVQVTVWQRLFLWNVCMFSGCLWGFSLGCPASSSSPITCKLVLGSLETTEQTLYPSSMKRVTFLNGVRNFAVNSLADTICIEFYFMNVENV